MSVRIRLPFEGDIVISLLPVAVLDKPYQPLYKVNYIERNKQQFALLRRMNALMIDHILINPARISHPERAEQIHTIPFRYKPAFDNHKSRAIAPAVGKRIMAVRFRNLFIMGLFEM